MTKVNNGLGMVGSLIKIDDIEGRLNILTVIVYPQQIIYILVLLSQVYGRIARKS